MHRIKEHIVFRILTLALVFALLTPTAIKFVHIFNHHKHEICHDENQTHLHTYYADCSFHKFKLTPSYTIPVFSVEFFTPEHSHETTVDPYLFLAEFQQLHFSLRGPPQFDLI